MDTNRRDLMTRRDAALKAGDIAQFQALTAQIAALPLAGVPALTQKDIASYNADRTVHLSLGDAKALPNMLGRIVPAMLRAHGFYTATVNGAKTLYVLRAS